MKEFLYYSDGWAQLVLFWWWLRARAYGARKKKLDPRPPPQAVSGRNDCMQFFFFTCKKIYVFDTRKAWNGWFCKKKTKGKVLFNISRKNFDKRFQRILLQKVKEIFLHIPLFQNILSISFYFEKSSAWLFFFYVFFL